MLRGEWWRSRRRRHGDAEEEREGDHSGSRGEGT
jgi:hypothetical protein